MIALAALSLAVVAALRGTWSPCGLSMISSLNPMAERARGHRFGVTAGWFVVGSVLGGALLGVGSAVLAFGVHAVGASAGVRLMVGVGGCLIAVASDRRVGGFSLPVHPRQVDERWLHSYRRWVYAGGFGLQIGSGFATYIMTASTYLVVLLGGLTASMPLALAGGVLFGAVRGAAIMLGASGRSPDALMRVGSRLEKWAAAALSVTVGLTAFTALALAASIGLTVLLATLVLLAACAVGTHATQRTGAFHSKGSMSRSTRRRRLRGRWSM